MKYTTGFIVLALMGIVIACGGDNGASSVPASDEHGLEPVVNPTPMSVPVLREQLSVQTLAGGLDTPWDLSLDPSGNLWVTERYGAVSRVDTATGMVTRVGIIPDVIEQSESGLMGMAFHPDFPAQPYV